MAVDEVTSSTLGSLTWLRYDHLRHRHHQDMHKNGYHYVQWYWCYIGARLFSVQVPISISIYNWLVVSTHLKNISQMGLLFLVYGKIKFMFQTTNQIKNIRTKTLTWHQLLSIFHDIYSHLQIGKVNPHLIWCWFRIYF